MMSGIKTASSTSFGLGLRPPFFQEAATGQVRVDWFELNSENFMVAGGNPLRVLKAVCEHYPVALHGVSLNLGGSDALDEDYLEKLHTLVNQVQPIHISDHLCWTRHGGHHLHDLLPLPYTEEAVQHVALRIRQVQERLGQRILIENVSSYTEFNHSTLREWEFLAAVAETADCHILLDLNNIMVSAHNHGFDPYQYIGAVPATRVRQIHLAGHSVSGPLLIDTHDHPVSDAVWDLYATALRRFGPVATMIERDDLIPPLNELLDELDLARQVCIRAFAT
ncbi:MAG: MNIO family bufferin maturase [Sulfuriferula sp.]